MAILHSCCFWRSVRKGSYASVIYTMVYFGISCIIISIYLYDERQYLAGDVDKPMGESFLEKESISSTTVIFNILLLICASCGIIASILVILGLRMDQRALLLPWIFVMFADVLVEVAHFIYLIILEKLQFEPLTSILFTTDFFIMCLNIYCLLCVTSQYQEYKAGRGGAPINGTAFSHYRNVEYLAPENMANQCTTSAHRSPPTGVSPPPILCTDQNCTSLTNDTQIMSNGNTENMKMCCTDNYLIDDHNGNGQLLGLHTITERSDLRDE